MSTKQIHEPLVQDTFFDGGEDGDEGVNTDTKELNKSLWCRCTEEDECGPSCTFQKFPQDEGKTKSQRKQRFKDRVGFIKKTYGILLCQLLFTATFVGAAVSSEALGKTVQDIWIVAAIIAVVSILVLIFASAKQDDDKAPQGVPMHLATPYNYILLALFTVCTSIMVAKISLASKPQLVFEAFVMTTAAVIGISIFALTGFKKIQGVKEFSIMAPLLSAVGMIFAVTGLFVFLPVTNLAPEKDDEKNKFKVMYATIAIILFSLIMLFDTSQVVGGKSMMFELGPECYILGALQLYLEYINMFVLILVILGETG